MKVTNTQNGPRGLNTKSGPVLVEPGQTVDVELTDAEAKVAKDTGWFEFARAASTKEAEKKAESEKKAD